MLTQNQRKGYGLAFVATVAGSLVYIFSKAAFLEVSIPQFGVYWFLMAILWNALFALRKPESRVVPKISEKTWKTLFLLGFVEIVATTGLYGAIYVTSDASIPSFLRNLEFIFIGIFGVVFLKEKFSYPELIGVVLTISGALIISYHKGADFKAYLSGTSGLMLVSSIFYAIRTIIVKKNIITISPTMLALNRAVFILIFSLIILSFLNQSLLIPFTAFINIALGSFFGPFMTSITQYSALKYIEASKGAIIQSTTPFFVLIVGYFYFAKFPLSYQIFGGILTIAGTVMLILGKDLMSKMKHL